MLDSVRIWQTARILKWVCWVALALYYVECIVHRSAHQNQFGQLLHTTEFWMFFLPIAAVAFGFLEIASREKAGFARPNFLRDWSGMPAELARH
jgi:hypothetical protein